MYFYFPYFVFVFSLLILAKHFLIISLRFQITSFNRKLQGNFRPGSSWLVFDGHQGARLEPKAASSASFTFTDIDQVIVRLTYIY